MACWLLKSEPLSWSWDDQVKAGSSGTAWSGVRNHLAKKNLSAMKKGDQCFFYHSNEGKEVVGIVEIIKEAYPDPTAKKDEPWLAVDVKAKSALKKQVTLADIRANSKLSKMALIKCARLSVQPVMVEEWKLICRLGGA